MTPSSPRRQARRAVLTASFAALLLAGCSGGPGLRPEGPGPGGARNRVAVLVPTSGPDAAVGQGIANAARLALADSGGDALDLTVYNTAEAGASAAAQRALASGAGLILGPLLGDQVRTVAPLAGRAGVPVLAFSNDERAAGNGTFILGVVPGQAVARVIGEARRQGVSRFAALVPQTTYGERASEGLDRAVGQSGGRLTGLARYATLAEARAGLRRLNAAGYDALLIVDDGRTAAALAPAVAPGARILGPDLWAGERALGRVPRLRGALFAAPLDSRFGQFASRYKARFGAVPPRLASLGYDSVLLTVRAARQWAPGRRFPLRSLTDDEGFVGVDGVFRFTRSGVAERGLEVRQVTATGSQLVSPAPGHF
ncbi:MULTISPECIES: penicillin-binding protein activator [Sphingomonas]|uniref:penicillin-binding protein activator n=1 Tax=Sphingomonas TaxID=13687 RepID=UPI000DEEF765|nr:MULTISPECIES: penicillin-binding protein activator [Sphingomonas]